MDAYQQAVEYLTENPGEIDCAWNSPRDRKGGCLFQFAKPRGVKARPDGQSCGCLTMIRRNNYVAWTDALTVAIRIDNRIPTSAEEIEKDVDSLPVFAQWQRHIDKVLNRTPPAMDDRIPLPTKEVEFAESPLPPQQLVR